MLKSINDIISEFTNEIEKIYGTKLNKVLLYGSYARGDYSELSDIDIMVLVALSEEDIKKTTDSVSDCAFELLMQYGVDIAPIVKNVEHFEYWADTLPFYRNVKEEGVVLSA